MKYWLGFRGGKVRSVLGLYHDIQDVLFVLGRSCRRVSIPSICAANTSRRSFIRTFLRSGRPAPSVKELLLGHSYLVTNTKFTGYGECSYGKLKFPAEYRTEDRDSSVVAARSR